MKKLIIGICTVSTRPENYLPQTLASLLSQTTANEQEQLKIILFDCDMTAEESNYMSATKTRFRTYIDAGVLEIVRTTPEDYPDISELPSAFGDSPERVYWRTKQCLDYSLIFRYCAEKSDYYLHLEDDVICSPNFYQKLINDIERFPASDWAAMQFCELGFIGMLFKGSDLNKISAFFHTFCDEMPVDWLIKHFLALRRRKGEEFIRLERSLFQHVGYQSSLKGKLSALQSERFDGFSLHDRLSQHTWTKAISTLLSYGLITLRKYRYRRRQRMLRQ